jgi:RNA polymerase sigma-70 factor (ECF subfamily)
MTSPRDHQQAQPLSASPPGDLATAEAELAGRFRERIRLFAARRLGDVAAAEDLAQEVLRLVTESLRAQRVENLDALPGYVFRTAHHLCLQRLRAAGRESRALGRLGGEPGPDPATHDPLAALIGEERRVAVRGAIRGLGVDDRRLLTLLYYDGLGTEAAATRFGITVEALRVRKHRALRRLAARLGDAPEDVTP